MHTSDRALLDATRPFARESVARSWFHALLTLALAAALEAATLRAPGIPLRLTASGLLGLTLVRAFVLYHDFFHGALLRRSRAASVLFHALGLLVMTPPRVWRETHNYHHSHTAKIIGSNVGSYAMVTTDMWARMKPGQRLAYRVQRHPLTILFAYFTVFLLGMGIRPFLRAPRRHFVAGLTAALHVAAWVGAIGLGVFQSFFFAVGLPLMVACALGAYLFYAQHNFPQMHVQPRECWTYTRAALESSSYMEMGAVMRFFSGNIGYHHVHHLNPGIPFYRLPEAMAAIPGLQQPGKTSLRPRAIAACVRLKLWDARLGRMVGYPEGEATATGAAALTGAADANQGDARM